MAIKRDSIFRDLEMQAFRAGITPRTKESIQWFRKKARELFRGRAFEQRSQLMQDENISLRNRVNKSSMQMYMYFYQAKHRDTLKYYDGFPLVFIMGPAKGGFMGLNLHYLPPIMRARLLDAVLAGQGSIPPGYMAAAQKHYLRSQVRSKFALVDTPEWEIAAFLPMADWRGTTGDQVYRDSRRIIR